MIRLALILFLLFTTLCLSAQPTLDWMVPTTAKFDYAFGFEQLRDANIITDAEGSVFVAGYAGSTTGYNVVFGSEEIPLQTSHRGQYYLTKISASGEPLWIRRFSGINYRLGGIDYNPKIVADGEGGVYLASLARQDVYFGDEFVANFNEIPRLMLGHVNASGELDDFNIVASGLEFLDAILLTNNGELVVSGRFNDFSCQFGDVRLTSTSDPAYFIARLTTQGQLIWANQMPTDLQWQNAGNALGLVEKENGELVMSVSPGGPSYRILGCNANPFFFLLASFDGADGELRWQREIGRHSFGFISDLAVAPNGDLYAIGGAGGNLLAENGQNATFNTEVCNQRTGFLMKITPDGEVYQMTLASQSDFVGHQLNFLSDGSYVIAGRVSGNTNTDAPTLNRGFAIQQFSPYGELLNSHNLTGYVNNYWITMDVTNDDKVVLAAPYHGRFLDYEQPLEVGDGAFFTAQITLPQVNVTAPELRRADVNVFPNPTASILHITTPFGGAEGTDLRLFDAAGRQVRYLSPTADRSQHRLSLQDLPAGVYTLRVANDRVDWSYRVVKL